MDDDLEVSDDDFAALEDDFSAEELGTTTAAVKTVTDTYTHKGYNLMHTQSKSIFPVVKPKGNYRWVLTKFHVMIHHECNHHDN